MNYLLKNRIDEVEEMKKSILEAENLEKQILSLGKSVDDDILLARQFKDKVKEIRFAQSNIVQGLKYIEVESDEEYFEIMNIIEFVKTAKYCEFDEAVRNHLIDDLLDVEHLNDNDGKYYIYYREKAYELLRENDSYLDKQDNIKLLNIVSQALRDEKTTKKTNYVAEKYFTEYYNTRKLIEMADEEDFDYGASIVHYISTDYTIDLKYAKAIKKAYQDYLLEEKYQNMDFKSRVAIGTGQVIAFPLKVAKFGLKIGFLGIELAGMTFKLATNALAYPFEKIASKLEYKYAKNAIENLQGILLSLIDDPKKGIKSSRKLKLAKAIKFPAIVFKGVGNAVSATCNITSALLDVGSDILMMPFDKLVKAILKAGDTKAQDKLDSVEEKIRKNLSKALKQKDESITKDDITIVKFDVKDDVLSMIGAINKNNNAFKIDYKIDKQVAEKLRETQKTQARLLKNLEYVKIFKEVENILKEKGSNVSSDDLLGLKLNLGEEKTQVDKDFGFENIGLEAEMQRALIEYKKDNSKNFEGLNSNLKNIDIESLVEKDDEFDLTVLKEAIILSNITSQNSLNIEYLSGFDAGKEMKKIEQELMELAR